MTANLRNCVECGRLFAYIQGRPVCSRCMEQEEEKYLVVRRYIRDHPGATVFEVADETGIEEELILQFLREGRLQSKGFAEVLECQRCGKRINSGKYCENCVRELDTQIRGLVSSDKRGDSKPSSSGSLRDRMHTKDVK